MFPKDPETLAEELEFEMSGMDDDDDDDDYDPSEFHDRNDELTEADAQACWALEVMSQVALMNHRSRF
jgi:hypothetical protein